MSQPNKIPIKINPSIGNLNNSEMFKNHLKVLVNKEEPILHTEILENLFEKIEPLDFQLLAFPQVEKIRNSEEDNTELFNKYKVNKSHYLVITIEILIEIAKKNKWGLCKNQEFIYLYNGAYWSYIDKNEFQYFLGVAAEKMGVPKFIAKHYRFRDELLKQFLATEYLPTPEIPKDIVYINLRNGTFEIRPSVRMLRQFDRKDFITYQLPFKYLEKAKAPIFQSYLDRVLPDKERQRILAEYLGFLFIKHGSNTFKEEKALILYGTGANGKSVFFEVVNALLGVENISTYSLQSLTDRTGYYRAMIANKLVNYATEMNGKLETAVFKQIVSGEPVEARLPYGNPMQIKQYAKLIFNCNELPKDVEHTLAFFRRFLIVPFDVTIPEHEQDKQLHIKIIENELSGVFNWVLDGLNRLLEQKGFSDCKAAKHAINLYKIESNSVKLFMVENGYQKNSTAYKLIKELYNEYRDYCTDDGFKAVQRLNFRKRLESSGIQTGRKNIGNVAYISKGEEIL